MATYVELYNLRNSDLRNRVMMACIIAAETVMNEDAGVPNHTNRLLWAKAVFQDPRVETARMYMAVLAANNTAAIAAITGATDTTIQTNVDDHIDLFANGS